MRSYYREYASTQREAELRLHLCLTDWTRYIYAHSVNDTEHLKRCLQVRNDELACLARTQIARYGDANGISYLLWNDGPMEYFDASELCSMIACELYHQHWQSELLGPLTDSFWRCHSPKQMNRYMREHIGTPMLDHTLDQAARALRNSQSFRKRLPSHVTEWITTNARQTTIHKTVLSANKAALLHWPTNTGNSQEVFNEPQYNQGHTAKASKAATEANTARRLPKLQENH